METLGNEPFAGTMAGQRRSDSEDELKGKASDLAHKASDRAFAGLDAQKDQLSGMLAKVADAISDDPLGRHAAGYVRRGADYLRGGSTSDLVAQAQSQLRARPGAMISMCLLAGFTLARLSRR